MLLLRAGVDGAAGRLPTGSLLGHVRQLPRGRCTSINVGKVAWGRSSWVDIPREISDMPRKKTLKSHFLYV